MRSSSSIGNESSTTPVGVFLGHFPPGLVEHPQHPPVLGEGRGREALQPGGAAGGGEVLEEHRSDPPGLVLVGDRERDLGDGRVVAPLPRPHRDQVVAEERRRCRRWTRSRPRRTGPPGRRSAATPARRTAAAGTGPRAGSGRRGAGRRRHGGAGAGGRCRRRRARRRTPIRPDTAVRSSRAPSHPVGPGARCQMPGPGDLRHCRRGRPRSVRSGENSTRGKSDEGRRATTQAPGPTRRFVAVGVGTAAGGARWRCAPVRASS